MIKITARQFRDLVSPVLPLACTGRFEVPILNAVQIRSFDGKLAAVATDRYRIGLQLSEIDAGDFPDFVLPAKAARLIIRSFPANRKINSKLEITVREDGIMTVSGETGNEWCPTLTLQISPVAGPEKHPGYPDLMPLLTKHFHVPKIVTTQVSVDLFSGFADAARGSNDGLYDNLQVHLSDADGAQPIVVRAGASFMGIIMPVRAPQFEDTAMAKVLAK